MRIIVAGAGEVGTHLAKMLSKEKHDLIVLDTNSENIRQTDSTLDVMTINGSTTSFEALKNARVYDADLFIAVTPIEEVNIIAAIFAKTLGAKKTIARISNKEYLLEESIAYFKSLGIDRVICPEILGSNEVVKLLNQAGTTETFDFSDGKLSLYVIKLEDEAPVLNKSFNEVAVMAKNFDFRAIAICRDYKTLIPRGTDQFLKGDLVYILTNKAGISEVLRYSGKTNYAINNIMILGGSRIGANVAKELELQKNVKLIEINKAKSIELARIFNKTLVINGDGTDINLLEEEGIRKMDAFVAVTGNSETNILTCLRAKKLGVKKTIAEIENIDYIDVAENIGIDTIINKKLITASHIYAHTMNAEVTSLKCLTGVDAEIVEFLVSENSKVTKELLMNTGFPKDAIIGGVIRNNDSFIAKGNTQIQAGDKVIVFSLPEAIAKIEKFFK